MAIIPDKTQRLDLPKPNVQNFLQDDVERLREALEDIGQLAATIAADGKLDPAQIPDSVAQWDANQIIDASHMPGTVVQTDSNGKIPLDKIPQAAQVTRYSVATEAAMLALPAIPGDICRRTDIPAYFLLMDTPATNRDAWRRLHADDFYDQFASKSDPLAGIKGPLALKAEGVGDYDAATIKQLKSVSNSGNAATMSGVMNNFIGAVEWFNGSRLNLPAGYVAADGQPLSRTAYPDLWAAVNSGMLLSIDDTGWWNLAGVKYLHRSKYSMGDGATTFRVPDLNGAQADSLPRIFLAGSKDGSTDWTLDAVAGITAPQSAPNIIGGISPLFWNGTATSSGAFYAASNPNANVAGNTGTANILGMATAGFDASKSTAPGANTTYGKLGSTLAPNHAGGVWIIRANGSFSAANTAFNVINKDTVAPANGTSVSGGALISSYHIGNTEIFRSRLYSQADYGQTLKSVLAVEGLNQDGTIQAGNKANFEFNSIGNFTAQGVVDCNGLFMIGRGIGSPSVVLSEMDNTSVSMAMRRTNTQTAGPRNIVSFIKTSSNPGDNSKAYLHVDGGYICR
ncbi:phage tail protein, partial [Salmonella enterica]